jgi:hypothetical protein
VGGRALGSLAVAWDDEHDFTPAELDLLEGFAAQCAQAVLRIETTQRERKEVRAVRRLAEELQDALLTPPPEPDHLHVVVRYRRRRRPRRSVATGTTRSSNPMARPCSSSAM